MKTKVDFHATNRDAAAMVEKAITLPSRDAAKLPSPGIRGDSPCVVECYRKRENWNSRYLAYHYFLTGAMACDGSSEGDRYWAIVDGLQSGTDFVSDSDTGRLVS